MSDRADLLHQVRMAVRTLSPSLGRLNDLVGLRVDLKGGDIEVLDHLGRSAPISPSDLAESLQIHPATMTGILDRLEEGGWVLRERPPGDRRRVRLKVLRSRGPELVRLYGPMNRAIDKICAGLGDDELRVVVEFLRAVSGAALEVTSDLMRNDR